VNVEPQLNRSPFVQGEIAENVSPLPCISAHFEYPLFSNALLITDLSFLPVRVDVFVLRDGHVPKGQGGADGVGGDSDRLI
jgi:hypothetical protein